ncbi:hypothetical protein [Denitrobaculum tricleocarpae]|uniref:Uncharacterized protein n=1 Tax=Denitrobaculum tricleocarpae TaxID=2591009 RepID=A0A545TMJ2_9PROT|nr:hypothetical protein [Denitrobaculum tricleocarpae]TQV78453.1 hypothetical protein FKG95_17985 [Denitrobaculum tricleocarpae]
MTKVLKPNCCLFRLAVLAMILTAGGFSADQSRADDVSGEGPFTVNFTSIAISPTPPVSLSDDRHMGIAENFMTATNASGKGLLHNLTGRCIGWFVVYKSTASYEFHGHCNYIDADGDTVFEKADFDVQPLDSVRVGTGKWLGGTGKYKNLSGVFEIRTSPLKPIREGFVQGIGTKQGNYSLPPSGALK